MVTTSRIAFIQQILADTFSKFESVDGVFLSGDDQQFRAIVITNFPMFDRAGMDELLKAEDALLDQYPDLRLFVDYFPAASRSLDDLAFADAILIFRRQ